MFKYDVGDKVIYDNKECIVTGQLYFKEHINKKVVINENKDYIVEDKKGNKYSCKEGDLRKMKRIDEILNSEDPYDTLATMLEQSCGTHCIFSKNCEGKDCKEGIKEYLNKEIDKPKVKSDNEPIGVRKREEELKTPEEYLEEVKRKDQQYNNDDKVNHPSHYNQGIEAIDIIESWDLDFCLGNVIKYVLRAKYKNNMIEDLEKARWYLDREIDTLKNI